MINEFSIKLMVNLGVPFIKARVWELDPRYPYSLLITFPSPRVLHVVADNNKDPYYLNC